MYNPSRGGVRGGADQFTWESVKTDKHRENYLGHSLKAPVGRWQKGKDLSWFAKERKDTEDAKIADKSELTAIKRAEQEAMLIALGHNVIRKENQSLTKEEMTEALKRNIGDRDQLNIERVDGVGTKSGRVALLSGTRSKNEGVTFETHDDRTAIRKNLQEESSSIRRSKNKKSKKHKKEKKKKSYISGSDYSENELPFKKEYMNDRTRKAHTTDESEDESFSKQRYKKEKKTKKSHDSNDSSKYRGKLSSKKRPIVEETKQRHDTEDSNDSDDQFTQRHKQRKENKRRHDKSDSGELSNSDFCRNREKDKLNKKHYNMSHDESDNHSKSRKEHNIYKRGSGSNNFNSSIQKTKSEYGHKNLNDFENDYHESRKEKCKSRIHEVHVKRRRHDTSESD